MKSPPPWLADFEARFGATLRASLDRSTGRLEAAPSAYDASLTADTVTPARLAVYNRQYWFRLFEVMHAAFPLVTRLVGPWEMNGHVARFLLAHPPRSWDIDAAGDGFEDFLTDEALREAARVDAAWRRVRRAPAVTPFRPTAADAARLLESALVLSPAVAFVRESWPLMELRATPGDGRLALPARLPAPRAWVLAASAEGIRRAPLDPRQATLYELLTQRPLAHALAELESSSSPDEAAELPELARRWLAESVERGYWSGLSSSQMTHE